MKTNYRLHVYMHNDELSCLGIDKLMIKYKVKEITVFINKIVKKITV
jgi:hypothetical protein